ncbi:MAG: hypothetical protein VZS44_12395 [Bacilli bacterium]|nr:hypothetical protein [Bacilli bacterium]
MTNTKREFIRNLLYKIGCIKSKVDELSDEELDKCLKELMKVYKYVDWEVVIND